MHESWGCSHYRASAATATARCPPTLLGQGSSSCCTAHSASVSPPHTAALGRSHCSPLPTHRSQAGPPACAQPGGMHQITARCARPPARLGPPPPQAAPNPTAPGGPVPLRDASVGWGPASPCGVTRGRAVPPVPSAHHGRSGAEAAVRWNLGAGGDSAAGGDRARPRGCLCKESAREDSKALGTPARGHKVPAMPVGTDAEHRAEGRGRTEVVPRCPRCPFPVALRGQHQDVPPGTGGRGLLLTSPVPPSRSAMEEPTAARCHLHHSCVTAVTRGHRFLPGTATAGAASWDGGARGDTPPPEGFAPAR